MDQYHPAGRVGTDERYETINRRIQPPEFEEAVRAAQNAGFYRLDSGASAPRASCGPCLKGAEPCAKITWRTLQGQAPCISCRDSHRSPQSVQVAHGLRACPRETSGKLALIRAGA